MLPGQCNHCDRTATSAFAHWTGGAPGVGEYLTSAQCDYHLGDPPGSIPGRCWACGLAIVGEHWIYSTVIAGVFRYANFHPGCPHGDDVAQWDGPRGCARCAEPIGYGQKRIEHHQAGRTTIYTHERCPR